MVDLPPESGQVIARQLQGEQRRAAILAAAAELFDRRGYETTRLNDIAEYAQVSKPILYRYFGDKEGLARAITEFQSRLLRQAVSEMEARGYASLEVLIRITFDIGGDPISRAGLRLAAEGLPARKQLRRPFAELLDISNRKLIGAVEESDISPDADVNAAAHSLVYLFAGMYAADPLFEPVASWPRRVADLWGLIIRGLVPERHRARYLSLAARLSQEPSESMIDNEALISGGGNTVSRSSDAEVFPLPVTIYLADEDAHAEVQAAVEHLLADAGFGILDSDPPVIGSWFRRMRATLSDAARSQIVREGALTAAHIADARLVLAQDATITATMMQNVGPVITSLQPTKDAVVRIGAVLIVKVDWEVRVMQLTAAQQAILDHKPELSMSPRDVIGAISLLAASDG